MTQELACPVCGTELSMAQLFTNEDTHRAFARLARVSIPLGARVMLYCTLFAPPKTRLTIPKQVKVIMALLPDMERQAITYKGRDWAVPIAAWGQAIDQMLNARDAGKLELPMKGHGYLYSILCGMADKQEAVAEAQSLAQQRSAGRQDTVQVRGQTLPIGAALDVVYGERDAALAKLDADDANAAPMPNAVRKHIAGLLGSKNHKP